MCTVSFIPQEYGFTLTSNRDEAPGRSPVLLSSDDSLVFPKDTLAGGTWVCASAGGALLCLLNGAFEKHVRQLPYRKSRGLVVLDAFTYPDLASFFEHYDLVQIEPFTLVAIEGQNLAEFRWDGEHKHLKYLDANQPHIWSSATLYPAAVRETRLSWFNEWLKQTPGPNREDIYTFHQTAGAEDPWNGLVMNRNNLVLTVSITSVERRYNQWYMRYHDRMTGQNSESSLDIHTPGT